MLLIVYHLVFMLGGSVSAYLIGLIVERAFGSYAAGASGRRGSSRTAWRGSRNP